VSSSAPPTGATVGSPRSIRIGIPPGWFITTSTAAGGLIATALILLQVLHPDGPLAAVAVEAVSLVLFLLATMLLAGLAFLTVARIPYAIALGFWIAWLVQAAHFGLTYSAAGALPGAESALAVAQVLERLTPLIGTLGIVAGLFFPRRVEPAGVFRAAVVASLLTLGPLVLVFAGWPVETGLERWLTPARGLVLLEPLPAFRLVHAAAAVGVLLIGLFIRGAWERVHPGGGWWVLGALGLELAWQGLAYASTAAGDTLWLYSRIAIAVMSAWLVSGLAAIYHRLWRSYLELVERDRERLARLVELDQFKDDLLAKISHELRTPAAALAGFAELLSDERNQLDSETVREILGSMQESGVRLGDLAAKVLEASGRNGQSEPPVPVDLHEVTAAALRAVGVELPPERVQLRIAGAPPVLARRDDLVDVLTGLLQNVSRHAGPRPTVYVTALAAPAGRVTLVVEDDGPGLPMDDTGALFGKFGRLSRDPGTPGVGLGLYLARRHLESMGGSIRTGPKEGRGAAFVIELPALEQVT
jgi:signal transduction histidine kinase